MTALIVTEGSPFASGAPLGLDAPRLLAPPPAPVVRQGGPLAAPSTLAFDATQTLDEPVSRSRSFKMPALVPGGWGLIMRGGAAVATGALALGNPNLSAASLVSLVSAYAIADGACTLFGTLRTTRAVERWWPLLLEGLVSVGLGVQAMLWPGVSEGVLLYYVALWSLVAGALELVAARRLREEIGGESLLALRGLCALGFGALLLFGRHELVGGLLPWLGPSAMLFGVLHVALGLRLRSWDSLPAYDALQLLRSS